MEEEIRRFVTDVRSEAEQVAENHRQNLADLVECNWSDEENAFVVVAYYSK